MTPSCYDQPNRPLGYVEDDIKQPILTSNKLIFGQLITCSRKVRILSKNQTYVNLPNIYADAKIGCGVGGGEYLKALRKRLNMFNNLKQMTLKEGDVASSFP